MEMLLFCLLGLFIGISAKAVLTPNQEVNDMTKYEAQLRYLEKYNYLGADNPDPKMRNMSDKDVFTKAVRTFQTFMGLNVTGVMDASSIRKMSLPRCGFPDILPRSVHRRRKRSAEKRRRRKRFVYAGWGKNTLTYRLTKFHPDMDAELQKDSVEIAYQHWQNAAEIYLERASLPVDIEISFENRQHQDTIPFGRRDLAHAFLPDSLGRFRGDIHINKDIRGRWTTGDTNPNDKSMSRVNMMQVLTHEAGHTLGLQHSYEEGAVMNAVFEAKWNRDFSLQPDDISTVQRMYGPRMGPTKPIKQLPAAKTTTPTPTTTTTFPWIWDTTTVPWWQPTTTTRTRGTTTFPWWWPTAATRTTWWWETTSLPWWQQPTTTTRTTSQRPLVTRPAHTTTTTWPGWWGTTTTSYLWNTAPIVTRRTTPLFCQDNQVDAMVYDNCLRLWAFRGYDVLRIKTDATGARYVAPGYPRPISQDWTQLNSRVDAAYAEGSYTYLFSGYFVYVYVGCGSFVRRERIDIEFPGLSGPIDAALRWTDNRRVYFFKDDIYYRMTNLPERKFIDDGFPRSRDVWNIRLGSSSLPISAALDYNGTTYFISRQVVFPYMDRILQLSSRASTTVSELFFTLNCSILQRPASLVIAEDKDQSKQRIHIVARPYPLASGGCHSFSVISQRTLILSFLLIYFVPNLV